MSARLASGLLVSALIRRVEGAGGNGMVLAKGEPGGGAILLISMERGRLQGLFERTIGPNGSYVWSRCGPQDVESSGEADSYIQRRRASDPDLWVIELDIAQAERFAAETTDGD